MRARHDDEGSPPVHGWEVSQERFSCDAPSAYDWPSHAHGALRDPFLGDQRRHVGVTALAQSVA
jgi:hypothetical protein